MPSDTAGISPIVLKENIIFAAVFTYRTSVFDKRFNNSNDFHDNDIKTEVDHKFSCISRQSFHTLMSINRFAHEV